MTVSVLDTKEVFAGDGSTVAFPFTFKVDQEEDLLVFLTSITGNETLLELDTDYTVVLNTNQNTNPGGTVTLVTAPGVEVPLVIMRGADFTRITQFTNSVPPNIIEQELDRLTMYVQQLREKLDRSLHLSAATQLIANANYGNIVKRAGKIAGFNDEGQAALYEFEGGSIVGPPGPVQAARVEYSTPAIFRQASNQVWSHTQCTVTFYWTIDGVEAESRSVAVTIDTATAAFNDPGLSEPGDEFTSTLVGTKQLRLTSEYNGLREYAQLAIVDLPDDGYPTDTFTPAWGTGQFTIDPVGDVSYASKAGTVSLFLTAALTAESATSAMTWDAGTIPAGLRPAADRSVECVLQYNDTVEAKGQVVIGADGSAVFTMHDASTGLVELDGTFQTGEDKGLPAHWSVVYSL